MIQPPPAAGERHASATGGVLRPATPALIEDAWPELRTRNLAYLAASRFLLPSHPRLAAEQLLGRRDDLVLAFEAGGTGLAVVRRMHAAIDAAQLLVAFPGLPPLGRVVGPLLRALGGMALASGCAKWEWLCLETWTDALAAAKQAGFVVEASMEGACMSDGRYRDLLILGALAEEDR